MGTTSGSMHNLIAEISLASAEQSTAVNEVQAAIGRIDQVTQQHAALVEQSAAASESLTRQATRSVDALRLFRRAEPSWVAELVRLHRVTH